MSCAAPLPNMHMPDECDLLQVHHISSCLVVNACSVGGLPDLPRLLACTLVRCAKIELVAMQIMAMTTMKDHERLDLLKEIGGTKVYEERRKESLNLMQETETRRQRINEVVSISGLCMVKWADISRVDIRYSWSHHESVVVSMSGACSLSRLQIMQGNAMACIPKFRCALQVPWLWLLLKIGCTALCASSYPS